MNVMKDGEAMLCVSRAFTHNLACEQRDCSAAATHVCESAHIIVLCLYSWNDTSHSMCRNV